MGLWMDDNGISLWDIWMNGKEIQEAIMGQAWEEAEELRKEQL